MKKDSDEDGPYESLTIVPMQVNSLLDSTSRAMMCNLFFTMGNSLTPSKSVHRYINATTPSTVTTKIVALHVTESDSVVNPATISRGKKY